MQWRIASIGARGQNAPLDSEKLSKIGKKRGKIGKNREKEEKSGRKGQNREGSFTLPLLTNRAGLRYCRLHACECGSRKLKIYIGLSIHNVDPGNGKFALHFFQCTNEQTHTYTIKTTCSSWNPNKAHPR